MSGIDLRGLSEQVQDAARYLSAALHALAREETLGRRSRRLLEDDLATWQRFRGRLTETDLALLLLEDAAVTQPFAFDAAGVLGATAVHLDRLDPARLRPWLRALPGLPLAQAAGDYLGEQARRLGLTTRLGRSDLHRGIRPHHKVLELPGTGGQLASYLVASLEGIYLRDVFTIAWGDWRDRLLAGLTAVDGGLSGQAPIAPTAGIDDLRSAGQRWDYVLGAVPERGVQPYDLDTLRAWFPGATVLLV